ncbi:prepilin peptidase [Erwinia sp. 9145]|uniref:A24 family peptidase n=1 Tax=Erwinia sp. 9145 TaxID=1500895 RepID=UPI0005598E08|nr:prepilin peptidase [Erwinia sp. 9145]
MAGWLFILLVPLLIDVCYTDARYRIIRNHTTLLVAILCAGDSLFSPAGFFWLPALCILLGGFFLSLFNIIGAGDIKLMAALALSFDTETTLAFLFATALAGLPLILVIFIINYCSSRFYGRKNKKNLPYGIAIVSGYLATSLLLRVPA